MNDDLREPTETADEFAHRIASIGEMTIEKFRAEFSVLRCFCTDYDACTGWQKVRRGSDRQWDALADAWRMAQLPSEDQTR